MVQPSSEEDIFLWADGTWCYREQGREMKHMSDDFEVIPFDTPRWHTVVET